MPDIDIQPRTLIAQSADEAAREYANAPEGTLEPVNPFPVGSDAAAAWRAAFLRYLLLHSAPAAEASA